MAYTHSGSFVPFFKSRRRPTPGLGRATLLGMHRNLILSCLAAAMLASVSPAAAPDVVKIDTGRVKGAVSNGVASFRGIPYATPPVGALRWKAPQPAPAWKGVRETTEFGPRCMQGSIYNDMVFRDKGPSEDCLYLNVWTPCRGRQGPPPRHGLDLRRRLSARAPPPSRARMARIWRKKASWWSA